MTVFEAELLQKLEVISSSILLMFILLLFIIACYFGAGLINAIDRFLNNRKKRKSNLIDKELTT